MEVGGALASTIWCFREPLFTSWLVVIDEIGRVLHGEFAMVKSIVLFGVCCKQLIDLAIIRSMNPGPARHHPIVNPELIPTEG